MRDRRTARPTSLGATLFACLLLGGWLPPLPAATAGPEPAQSEVCRTVDGAPAATSEPLVLGMLERMQARDEAGLRKYLELGQAMLLRGGHEVEVLERRPGQNLVSVRRGPRSLPFWTVEQGIACESLAPRS